MTSRNEIEPMYRFHYWLCAILAAPLLIVVNPTAVAVSDPPERPEKRPHPAEVALLEELSLWIDHKMFVLKDGYDGWVKSGGAVQSGKIRTKIVYLPKPGPGEIHGDEFMNIVQGQPDDKLILDVRSPEEASEGKIEWAKNIPVDDLQSRLSELSKDKEIIIHCGTGMRAQMAHSVLQNAGYKSRFLNDKVAFLEKRTICCFKE